MRERNRINSLQYRRERRREHDGGLFLWNYRVSNVVCVQQASPSLFFPTAWIQMSQRLESVEREQQALATFIRSISAKALAMDQWLESKPRPPLSGHDDGSHGSYSSDDDDNDGDDGNEPLNEQQQQASVEEPLTKRGKRANTL